MRGVDPCSFLLAYHLRTRHFPHRFARSLGYLDWDAQPRPFLRHAGAPLERLPRDPPVPDVPFDDAVEGRVPPVRSLDRDSISAFLWLSFSLSAAKEASGSRWTLRVNPSSGNLHPTEVTLLVPDGDGASVLHYRPDVHGLERRGRLSLSTARAIGCDRRGLRFFVGLSSIPWREAWKYGERAYRYCLLDLGHALACASVAAAAFGWRATLLPTVSDDVLQRLLALDPPEGHEACYAEAFLAITEADREVSFPALADPKAVRYAEGPLGRPEPLGSLHHDWPVVHDAARASRRHEARDAVVPARRAVGGTAGQRGGGPSLARIVRRRRSAVAMDGRTAVPREAFVEAAGRIEGTAPVPHDVFLHDAPAPGFFFVHRVTGLDAGVYAVEGTADGSAGAFREALDPAFEWAPVEDLGGGVCLVRLRRGDMRGAVAFASCGQEIAGDGAFAAAFLADLEGWLRRFGPCGYRLAHAAAGLRGHVGYLQAEKAGVRGTGIGCFFDEVTRRLLGASGKEPSVLYHFTAGGALDDPRIRTIDPYDVEESRWER